MELRPKMQNQSFNFFNMVALYLILVNFGQFWPILTVKKITLIFGKELAKIQLTKVSKHSFGDFVSSVCQYLHLFVSVNFFYGIPEFLHKNGNFEGNRKFRHLIASILPQNLLFLVHRCILPGKIDKE